MPDLETDLESPVIVRVAYENDGAEAKVTVEPEKVTLFFDRSGSPARTDLPRRVRWVVIGVERGDRVVVRPKDPDDAQWENLFTSVGDQGHLEATSEKTSIVCERPACGTATKLPLEWTYEAIVQRGGDVIGTCDPVVMIEEDP